MLSTVQRLAISEFNHPTSDKVEKCPIFQTLSSINNLLTLNLGRCGNQPFIRALDPERNPSNLLLCPHLEELVFYLQRWCLLDVQDLIKMACNRTLRGAKLQRIALIGLSGLPPRDEVFQLRDHVRDMEYRFSLTLPAWDDMYGEGHSENRSVFRRSSV